MKNTGIYLLLILFSMLYSCSSGSKSSNPTPPPSAGTFTYKSVTVGGTNAGNYNYTNVSLKPAIKLSFSAGINTASVNSNIIFQSSAGAAVSYTATYQNSDSTVTITPSSTLASLTKYSLTINTGLKSTKSANFESQVKY